MPRPKAVESRPQIVQDHWSKLTDEELIRLDLTTDEPDKLLGLVTFIPENHKDAHVEFRYDFRGEDRAEFTCVHGHHQHKAGFVMRVGDYRFLVGWMCGESIYGESFGEFTRSYDAAVERQNDLRRARQIRSAIDPFTKYLVDLSRAEALTLYSEVRREWKERLPWLFDQLRIKCLKHGGVLTAHETVRDAEAEANDAARYERECAIHKRGGPSPSARRAPIFKEVTRTICELPARTFFEEARDVQKDTTLFATAILQQLTALERALNGHGDLELVIGAIREGLNRLEGVIAELEELKALFQPGPLAGIVEWAGRSDNSKRAYSCSLTQLTMSSAKGTVSVGLPLGYQLPGRAEIAAFRMELASLPPPRRRSFE